MKHGRAIFLIAVILVITGVMTWLGYDWSVGHVRRWTGRPELPFVGCTHCHLVRPSNMTWSQPRLHHPSPAGMAVSPDGRRLFIALDDRDEIVEADTATRKVLRTGRVSGGPFGLVMDAKGERLFITCRNEDRVAVVNTADLKETATVDVGLSPVGIAFCSTPAGERLIVANMRSDDISVLTVSPLAELVRPASGREPYAVAASADGAQAFVSSRLAVTPHFLSPAASELSTIDAANGRVINRQRLESAHLSEGVQPVPHRAWTLVPVVKVRNLVPISHVANGWVMSSGLAIADPKGDVIQVPLDEANDYFADPSGIAVDPAGKRAYVASGGADVVSVVDLDRLAKWMETADAATRKEAIDDLTLSGEYVLARIPTGRNPRNLVLSPDGKTLFVAEHLDDAVMVIDTTTLKPLGNIVLGDGGMEDPIRRGERVFTQAQHTFQRQFSCRSCHPDGHVDGLSYDFDGDGIGDNLLDNRSLQGVAGTVPFKWNGKNPSLQIQCGPRFARVLMRTDAIPPKDLDDLVKFIESMPPTRTIHYSRVGKPLTTEQERGKQIFFATVTPSGAAIPRERQCQTCHRPPLYTNRLLSHVGTKGARDSVAVFDTPHLLGIGSSAPYLHDGRAKTLEELWTVYQTNDLHGVSSYMNKRQLNDLVEFLKTL